ncbi:LysR family transcriptional regulator [Rhizobium sp. BR 362]|uniref:LysR family transcriptional regulator n=1 Tax=Rhizobium sp. BR 362 TaxID=3040670 RepID=UPI002F407AAF
MTDIRAVDLNLLKTLDALLDECNVTRAAARLGLTQPAVSGMLTRLRESFGDPLFIRSQRGIVPTPRALELAGPVKQVLSEIEVLLSRPRFEPETADLTVTLAATDYAMKAAVVPFLTALRQKAPSIHVAVCPVENDRLAAQFEKGEIDLALLTPDTTPEGLRSRRLFSEDYVCALRAGHPEAACGRLTLDRFCALDHALMSHTGRVFWGATDEALAQLGRSRRVVISVPSFLVLLDIVRSSDLVAVIPRRLAARADGLAFIDPPVDIAGFTKIAAWHERTHRDGGHRWIRALLFETCGSLI